jgi:DNA-directed RNA polymerase subunit beta'
VEIIIRQMLRWVKVEEVGDTEFLIDEQLDKFVFQAENEKIIKSGKKPAKARPLLLGITKSALSTESFIAAASFQETTRVLTEASLYGKVDHLRRLKENIIMGRLIPAGTGYKFYRDVELIDDETEEVSEEIDLQIGN